MRLLILGGNGQVGHALRRSLAPLGDLIVTTRSGELPEGVPCEVADFDRPASLDALVDRVAPDVVVNAAAYTAVDTAEDDADAAYRANAEAPGILALACVDDQLRSMSTNPLLSEGEQLEEIRLKKRKLQLKDRMEEIVRQYSAPPTAGSSASFAHA